jgi:hypothetical protein
MSPSVSEAVAATGAANFIAGAWDPSHGGRTYVQGNPWRPHELVAAFPASLEITVYRDV